MGEPDKHYANFQSQCDSRVQDGHGWPKIFVYKDHILGLGGDDNSYTLNCYGPLARVVLRKVIAKVDKLDEEPDPYGDNEELETIFRAVVDTIVEKQ